MGIDVGKLLLEVQLALGVSQKELGAVIGKDRRTIQRWRDKGVILFRPDAEKLAAAVRHVRPDLAELALKAADEGDRAAGKAPPPKAEVIDDVLKAAAAAAGTSPEAMRRGIATVFARAEELGIDVEAVLAALR